MTSHGQDYVASTHFSGILWPLLPVLKATPLLSSPTFFSVPQPICPPSSVPIASWSYLLSFLPVFPSPQSSLLPFLPSSWSHLSPLPLGPTSHLSHLLLFLPSTVLPVPPPSAPLGARLFAAFALAGPLCLEILVPFFTWPLQGILQISASGGPQRPIFSPRSTGRPLLPQSIVDFPFVVSSPFEIL